MTTQDNEDLKYLLGLYLTDGDVRYRRLLNGLSDVQLSRACGVFAQASMFGTERDGPHSDEKGGFMASCVRMAIVASFGDGWLFTEPKT